MKWLGTGLLCLLVVGFARPVAAQPAAEVSVGYNYLQAKSSGDDESTKFPAGWYADVAGKVSPMVSIVGQITGNYKTFEDDDFKLKLHTFMAGVRASSAGNVSGFGQFLIGGAKLNASDTVGAGLSFSETDLAIQIGGGVNIAGSGPVGLRLGIDYLRVMAKDDGLVLEADDVNGFRFSAGITFGIGK